MSGRERKREINKSGRQPTANQIRKLYSFVIDACVKNPHRDLKLYRISCLSRGSSFKLIFHKAQ